MDLRRFAPGEAIAVRHVFRGAIRYAAPATVVQDTPERIVYFTCPGLIYRSMGTEAGEPTRDHRLAVRPIELEWTQHHKIDIVTPGAAHAADAYWRDGAFLGWYINLQEPLRRTPVGFDTMDQVLDLQIAPDLRAWRWKDEDEIADWVASGLMSPEQAAAVRAEGERVLALAQSGSPPFGDDWHLWQPDPAWPIPAFPPGWDEPPLDGWPEA